MHFPILSIVFFGAVVLAEDIQFNWNITKEHVALIGPNAGKTREMMLVNGNWPPQPITVNKGDVMKVSVTNSMDELTTLHAHGFLQKDNNFYDGPEGITQWWVDCAARYFHALTKPVVFGQVEPSSTNGMRLSLGHSGCILIIQRETSSLFAMSSTNK